MKVMLDSEHTQLVLGDFGISSVMKDNEALHSAVPQLCGL